MQGEKRYIISQPIGTIWCVVCELAKEVMFRVEYAETSIDQKLNHAWNCSSTKITYKVSIFQLKARVRTQNGDTKVICKIREKQQFGQCRTCIISKTKFKKKCERYLQPVRHGNAKTKGWSCTSSKVVAGKGTLPFVGVTAVVNTNEIRCQTLTATRSFKQKEI